MAKLYISEYGVMAITSSGNERAQVAAEPALAVQVLDYSAGVQMSAAFGSQTRFVRLHNDSICSLRFDGSNATTAYPRSPADTIEYYGVAPGARVSVITNT